MCRLQWATLTYYLLVVVIMTNDLSNFITIGTAADVEGCSNSNRSVCNGSTDVTCDCGYYRDETNCTAYSPSIGISTNTSIPDIAMTASSSYDNLHAAREARLHSISSAWCAKDTLNSSRGQYLQINLGRDFELSRIATQGANRGNISGYLTSYKISSSVNADVWYTYQETINSSDKIFPGNKDASNVSCNELNTSYTTPLVAGFVRVYPITWVGHICIRMELYGVPHKCPPFRNTCSVNSTCAMFRNSTVCSCLDGYIGDGQNCTDNDECKTQSNNICHNNTTCVNTQGSFTCVCKQGYHGNSNNCTDIDECLSNTHSCSPFAQCFNFNGSHSCRCTSGYHGNGYTCEDTNECNKGSHDCHGNASCFNKHGTYTCLCMNGFHGDGRNCTDIDECRWLPRVCHQHAVCLNTPGTHECRCLAGYEGNGYNCTVIYADTSSSTSLSPLYLGIVIGLPVVVLSVITVIICVFLFTRHRRNRVTRRPRCSKVSRPSSTVIGQIDQLFDEENSKRLRDSVSLRSLQFSIPSVHPSLVALNNIGSTTKNSTYETL